MIQISLLMKLSLFLFLFLFFLRKNRRSSSFEGTQWLGPRAGLQITQVVIQSSVAGELLMCDNHVYVHEARFISSSFLEVLDDWYVFLNIFKSIANET